MKKKDNESYDALDWLDFKGFLREEKELYSLTDDYLLPVIWMLLIPVLNVIYLVAFIIKLITIPLKLSYDKKQLTKIAEHTYDIEDTCENYKIIRNARGKMGLIWWANYRTKDLLLPSEYDCIQRSGIEQCYIIKKDSKCGLYDAEEKKESIEMEYNDIVHEGDGIFKLTKEGVVTRRNHKGDRIIS